MRVNVDVCPKSEMIRIVLIIFSAGLLLREIIFLYLYKIKLITLVSSAVIFGTLPDASASREERINYAFQNIRHVTHRINFQIAYTLNFTKKTFYFEDSLSV